MINDVLRRRRGKQRGRDLRYTLEVTFEEAAFGASKTITDPGERRRQARASFTVVVPAGTKDGTVKLLSGEGEPGKGGAAAGDLHVIVRVAEHPTFRRDGVDVHSDSHDHVHAGRARRRDRSADARRPGEDAHPRGHAARPRVPHSRPRHPAGVGQERAARRSPRPRPASRSRPS